MRKGGTHLIACESEWSSELPEIQMMMLRMASLSDATCYPATSRDTSASLHAKMVANGRRCDIRRYASLIETILLIIRMLSN